MATIVIANYNVSQHEFTEVQLTIKHNIAYKIILDYQHNVFYDVACF